MQLSRHRRRLLRSHLRRRRKGTETGELEGTMGANFCDELATQLVRLDDYVDFSDGSCTRVSNKGFKSSYAQSFARQET